MAEEQTKDSEGGNATHPPGSRVRLAPGLKLTAEQLALLEKAMPPDREPLVKQEFRSGYSGAVVILVSVGAGRAPLVVKLAHPHDLKREYDAYEEYVRQVSPQNIAHLQGEPIVSDDGTLGLLQYTFAGGESHLPTTSFQTYYETAGAAKASDVLNRLFRVFGRHWWADNRAHSIVLDEYYDRLLPVHLQAEPAAESTEPDFIIRAGESSVLVATELQQGQTIQLIGFEVTKARDEGRRLTLLAPPPSNQAAAPLRVRVQLDQPTAYCPGDVVGSMLVTVTATRLSLLNDAAKNAFPEFDGDSKTLTLSPETDGSSVAISLPNPLAKLTDRLYDVVEMNMSIIHGDLNMQNILVDAPTGFAWLIDFAETRVGPTLLDLQRLEAQVYTKLMVDQDFPLSALVDLMTRLHADPPQSPPSDKALQEPYTLLVTLRRLVRQYLIDDLDWNEYYYGLSTVLVGALKYDELDNRTRARALIAAAAAEAMIGKPLASGNENLILTTPSDGGAPAVTASRQETPPPTTSHRIMWVGMGIAVVMLLLAGTVGWQFMKLSSGAQQSQGPTAETAAMSGTLSGTAGADTAAGLAQTQPPQEEAGPAPIQSGDSSAEASPDVSQGSSETNQSTDDLNEGIAQVESTQDSAAAATLTAEPGAIVAPGAEDAIGKPANENAAQVATQTPADDAATNAAPLAGDTRTNDIDGSVYVFIPAGEFVMGSDEGRPDERPAHTVSLDAFWLMRDEVSNRQYAGCVAAGVCSSPSSNDWDDPANADFPVTGITWEQAAQYAQWAGGRLPTEAEWEMAARSNDERPYPWGNEPPTGELVNFNFTVGGPVAVGSYPDGAGPFGNLDMAGNVEEWVADRYDAEYYSASLTRNPQGPDEGPLRTVRGGSFFSNGMDVRTFAREKALPNANFDSVGFRVAVSNQ